MHIVMFLKCLCAPVTLYAFQAGDVCMDIRMKQIVVRFTKKLKHFVLLFCKLYGLQWNKYAPPEYIPMNIPTLQSILCH